MQIGEAASGGGGAGLEAFRRCCMFVLLFVRVDWVKKVLRVVYMLLQVF